MRHLLRAFWALLKTEVNVMLQYRGEIVLWSTWGLVNPLVLYAIFKAGAQSNSNGQMAGLTIPQIAAYYFTVMVIGHLSAAWDTHEMSYLVRSGRMSSMLLRPILPLWKSLAGNLAYKLCTLAFVGPMWLLVFYLIRPEFNCHGWQVVLGILATILAFAMNYCLTYVVALICFWTTKLDAVGEVYFAAIMFLGGRFAPLQALPRPFRLIAEALPFQYMAYFPVELLTGRMTDPHVVLRGFISVLAWLLFSIVLFRSLWAVAVRRYTAVSG
jgi:ABC-2 type transport system permease protein